MSPLKPKHEGKVFQESVYVGSIGPKVLGNDLPIKPISDADEAEFSNFPLKVSLVCVGDFQMYP
ncbi:hypothetical protein U1Q18_046119, partial [Sarracenia purpurea var. burkii]